MKLNNNILTLPLFNKVIIVDLSSYGNFYLKEGNLYRSTMDDLLSNILSNFLSEEIDKEILNKLLKDKFP